MAFEDGERGAGHPPLAFGSVAWCGARSLERRGRDLTGGARGVPRAPLPVCDGDPFFSIPLVQRQVDASLTWAREGRGGRWRLVVLHWFAGRGSAALGTTRARGARERIQGSRER